MIHNGDALTILRPMVTGSVNCCVTSPPYWGLRDYGIPPSVWGGDPFCDHIWQDASWRADRWGECDDDTPGQKQRTNAGSLGHRGDLKKQSVCAKCSAWLGCLGLEPTPGLYVDHLVELFREVRRVLRDDGVLWLNLGDSYANDGKWGGKTGGKHADALHGEPIGRTRRDSGLKPKDLVGVPWRCAFALQADGWYLRSDIIWAKPAPMPESVTDRPTRSHEYIFLLAKSEKYYCDMESVKEPSVSDHPSGNGYRREARLTYADENGPRGSDEQWQPKSWNGSKFDGQRDLAIHPNVGRKPRTARVHGNLPGRDDHGAACNGPGQEFRNLRDVWNIGSQPYPEAHFATFPPKLIEPCVIAGCPAGGIILDPFAGAGTTGLVAKKHGRKFIGIELNPAYVAMAEKRLAQEVLEFQ